MFLGFAGEGFKQEEQALLKPGQQSEGRALHRPSRRAARHQRRAEADGHRARQRLRGRQADRRDRRRPLVLRQARGRADDRSGDPPRGRPRTSTSCSPAYDVGEADARPTPSPSTRWSTGSGSASASWRSARRCAAAGTGVRVRDGARCRPAPRHDHAAAADRCCCGRRPCARGDRRSGTVPRSALERQLEGEILCTCGCRRSLATAACPTARVTPTQTVKLRQYLAEGKDHDAVIAAFVEEFGGQDILAARRSTRASTASRGCFRISSAPPAPPRRVRGVPVVAPPRTRRLRRARPMPATIPTLRSEAGR